MTLLNFILKSPEDSNYFTNSEGCKSQNWYGLTDGYFWIEVGNIRLLELTDEIIKEIEQKQDKKIDYFLIRPIKDLFDILLYVNSSIPEDIFSYISNFEKLNNYNTFCQNWLENEDKEDIINEEQFDLFELATFYGYNKLDLGYLKYAPSIWFLRKGSDIIIQWDFSQKSEKGTHVWTAERGEFSMKYLEFKNQVIEFYESFNTEIKKKIQDVILNWDNNQLKIDKDQLAKESMNRERQIQEMIKKIVNDEFEVGHDWIKIREAIERIKEYGA